MTGAIAALVLFTSVGGAQSQHRPWVQLDVGSIFIHERISTLFHGTTSRATADIGLGVNLGVPVTPWLIPDVSFHSSVGRDLPYHAISIGVAARTTNDRRLYGHLALARILGSQGEVCGGLCKGPNGNDRRWGFEFRTGMNFIDPEQFTLGPTLWYQQSVSPTGPLLATYKAWGIGLQVGFN